MGDIRDSWDEQGEDAHIAHLNGECGSCCPYCNNHLAEEAIEDLFDVISNTNNA